MKYFIIEYPGGLYMYKSVINFYTKSEGMAIRDMPIINCNKSRNKI